MRQCGSVVYAVRDSDSLVRVCVTVEALFNISHSLHTNRDFAGLAFVVVVVITVFVVVVVSCVS